MNIGQAARACGMSAKMIRHYETMGLLKPSRHRESGYRMYDHADLTWLHFIKRARTLGFPLEQIRLLLGLWSNPERASVEVKHIAQQHIAGLNQRIVELTEMRDTLDQLCHTCPGDQQPVCPILTELAPPP